MPLKGQPKDTPIPAHLDRWNWGAFLLNWIWGLGNGTFIALLMFVPLVNLVMWFVLGAKGSAWAWKNQQWASEEQYLKTQRNWSIAGFIVIPGFFLIMAMTAGVSIWIVSFIKQNDAYETTMQLIRSDKDVAALFGEPIDDGWLVTGNVSTSGTKGSADFAIDLSGPRCEGTAYSEATKAAGEWTVNRLVVRPQCQEDPIVLVPAS